MWEVFLPHPLCLMGWCGEGGIAVGGVNNSEMSVGCEA